MYTLSSEVNGTSLTLALADIGQFERILTSHLSAAMFTMSSDIELDAQVDALHVDVKVTTPSAESVTRDDLSYSVMTDTVIAKAWASAIVLDSWKVTDVILDVDKPGNIDVTYYVLVTRSPTGPWMVHDHVIIQTADRDAPDNPEDPFADGHFLQLSTGDQLRHFATS